MSRSSTNSNASSLAFCLQQHEDGGHESRRRLVQRKFVTARTKQARTWARLSRGFPILLANIRVTSLAAFTLPGIKNASLECFETRTERPSLTAADVHGWSRAQHEYPPRRKAALHRRWLF